MNAAPILPSLISAHSPKKLRQKLSDIEMTSMEPLDATFYTTYLLTLLRLEELPEARFLMKRVPSDVSQEPQFHSAHLLLKAAWKNDFAVTYELAQTSPWTSVEKPLVNEYINRVRESVVLLLSQAYTCIGLSRAAQVLGLGEAEASKAFQDKGWEVEGELVYPKPRPAEADEQNMDRIATFTNLVDHLQKSFPIS